MAVHPGVRRRNQTTGSLTTFASAFSGGKDQGHGTWDVVARGRTPILKLTFHGGRTREVHISYENKEFHLDGRRYFRTTASSDNPD